MHELACQARAISQADREQLRLMADDCSQAMLKHYMVNSDDCKSCPTSGCDYVGFVPLDVYGHLGCNDALVCEKCGATWKDKVQSQPSFNERV